MALWVGAAFTSLLSNDEKRLKERRLKRFEERHQRILEGKLVDDENSNLMDENSKLQSSVERLTHENLAPQYSTLNPILVILYRVNTQQITLQKARFLLAELEILGLEEINRLLEGSHQNLDSDLGGEIEEAET